ncbi:MAG: AI-2E family transporter [Saprospiraceae bacterium]
MINYLQRNILWILGFALLACLCWFFSAIVGYILAAWVLSMMGRPLMIFFRRRIYFRKWRLGPTGAAILTILTFYLFLVGILMLFVPTIVNQTRNIMAVDFNAIGVKLKEPFAVIDKNLHRYGLLTPEVSLADKTQETLLGWFGPEKIGDVLGTFITSAGELVIGFVSVTFILFFFLQEKTLFLDILYALVPNEYEKKVKSAVKDSSEVLTRYFGGLIVQLLSFSTMVMILLWLFGVKNAVLIGAFGGIFNIIPYLGPIIGNVFGCFITISSNLDLPINELGILLVKVIATFSIVQFIDNNFLGPYIFSKSVKAHPLEIFLVTLASAQVGGVLGMILGIPVYTILRVLAREFLGEFKVIQRWTGRLDDVIVEAANTPDET